MLSHKVLTLYDGSWLCPRCKDDWLHSHEPDGKEKQEVKPFTEPRIIPQSFDICAPPVVIRPSN